MKDAYYFSHDSNAKDDPKCALLIDQLGLEGYGIFWVLVEVLRDQPNFKYPLKLIPSLARKYSTSAEKINAVIRSYDLFAIENDTFFFSESLNRRMSLYLEKKKKLSEAGKKGNEIRWKNAHLSPSDNKAIAKRLPSNRLAIASKAKESKIKNTTLFESIDEIFLNKIPPKDNIERNWEGLQRHLNNYAGSLQDKNKIVQLSNFGQLKHPVWQFISDVQSSNGKILHPIAFILSRLEKVSCENN